MNWFEHYANAGISVLPIKTDGSKSPAIPSWAEYQLQIASADKLSDWHARGFGVGTIGGRVSGGLEIIDIDDPALARPFIESLKEFDANLIHKLAFIATPRRNSEGKSGVHIYYRCELAEGNQKLAMSEPLPQYESDGTERLNPVTGEPVTKPETLIETRGEGGYVLTVGCPAECHPTKNTYEHRMGCQIAELQPLTSRERSLFFRIAANFDRSVVDTYEHHPHEHGDDTPGNQFSISTSWDEILVPHGWAKCGQAGDVTHWRRPGKTKGTSATTGLKSTQGGDLFCVFSSNAHPFPGPQSGGNCSTHSKFDAYTKLNFAGDHSACAKHLASKGFGSREKMREESKSNRPPVVFETWDTITFDYLDTLAAGGDLTLDTGIESLDAAIGGVGFGEVVIVGGRPSHGKTMLSLQVADYFSQCGYSPLIFSEEMGASMLAKRRLQLLCKSDQEQWRDSVEMLRDEFVDEAKKRAPVYIAPKCGKIDRIIDVIDEAATKHELRIMVIDYAQLVRGKGDTRYEQVTDVSQKIREVTSRYQLLTVLICQLNRGNERANDRPRATDLRDSGQLEQDADAILLVDWPARRNPEWNGDRYDYFIYVEKNRNRRIDTNGPIKLRIEPERQRLMEMPTEWEPSMNYSEVVSGY